VQALPTGREVCGVVTSFGHKGHYGFTKGTTKFFFCEKPFFNLQELI